MKPKLIATVAFASISLGSLSICEALAGITARNFDCYEFGVVTVGKTITAPALQLFNGRIIKEEVGGG